MKYWQEKKGENEQKEAKYVTICTKKQSEDHSHLIGSILLKTCFEGLAFPPILWYNTLRYKNWWENFRFAKLFCDPVKKRLFYDRSFSDCRDEGKKERADSV